MHKWTKAAIGVCLALSALRFSQSQDRKTSDHSFFRDIESRDRSASGTDVSDTAEQPRDEDGFELSGPRNGSSRNGHTKPPIRTEGIGDDLPPSSKPEVADAAIFEDTLDDPRQRLRQIQLAAQKLRSPDSTEKERADARSLVAEGLREEFDADLSRRVEKLTQLEKQLEQLKAHVQKRREARDQLVQMQVQLLENEATGLAFPAEWKAYIGEWQAYIGTRSEHGEASYAKEDAEFPPNAFDSPIEPDFEGVRVRVRREDNILRGDNAAPALPDAKPDVIGHAMDFYEPEAQRTREPDSRQPLY